MSRYNTAPTNGTSQIRPVQAAAARESRLCSTACDIMATASSRPPNATMPGQYSNSRSYSGASRAVSCCCQYAICSTTPNLLPCPDSDIQHQDGAAKSARAPARMPPAQPAACHLALRHRAGAPPEPVKNDDKLPQTD